MGDGIGKEQDVAGLQIELAHSHRDAGGLVAAVDATEFAVQLGVRDRRLVAAGDQSGRSVAQANILERGDAVDLADHPLAGIGLAEGHIAAGDMTAAVDADIAAGAAQVEQGLVQREPVIGVDPAPHVFDPGGVVDMAFEDRAGLDDILEIDAVGIAVGMGLDVADPLAVALAVAAAAESLVRITHMGIGPGVHLGDICRGDSAFDDQVAVEFEEVVYQIGVFASSIDGRCVGVRDLRGHGFF